MKLPHCLVIICLSLSCGMVGVSLPASAQQPLVLKISHQFPANTDFRDRIARMFAQEVEKRTHGQIKFQIYPGASLYKAKQQFDAMANGALDMSVYPLTYSGGKIPQFNITLMPALIKSYKQAYDWKSAPIGHALEKIVEQHGARLITWIWQAGGAASRDKPIRVPDDVKGLKTRGAGKMMELMLQAAGASVVSFPSNEAYNAMQRGVVDALWTSSTSLRTFHLFEVAKYLTTARDHTVWFIFTPLVMSQTTYNKLTPGQQKIVTEVGASLEKYALDSCQSDDQKVAEVYAKAGDKVLDMNAADFLKWQQVARRSAWKDFAKKVKDGQQLLDMAEAVK